nr:uncharacterized protein LOC123771715 [Procambarus clarkii]
MGSSGHEEAARGVFWAWVEGATGNMALAFEGLVEQVRSWVALGLSGLGLSSVMDTLNTLLVGWMVFVALILIIGTFFYFKFIHHFESSDSGRSQDSQPRGESQDKKNVTEASSKRSAGGGSGRSRPAAAPPAEPARKPTIVPDGVAEPVSSPVATGADPDAARWTNNIFTWLYNSVDGGPAIKKTWLHTINENTVKTALEDETGILVEVVEIYKSSPAPVLSNMVVDCSPTDNLTITCDCDATIYLRIVTTRTQGEKTTESEYACAVRPLRGRLNIAIITSELMAVVKFDGWPEVSLKLEGIRNNASGFDEQQMLDVIDEVLTSALRNSVLDVNFQSNKNFPRFRRARQVPDPIIPVGYDSMVRELQTHPPSVSRKPKKPHGGSVHDEEIVEAGESFTALNFSSNLSQGINLTTSEEQLIARNLHKYPSLENSDIGDDISEICKSWEENYVPATGVPNEDKKKVEVAVGVFQASSKEDSKTQNFVLVASNRSKLIDEPRTAVSVGELEEEEPELVPILKRSIEVEPCIRRGGRSPLVLGKPKVEEPEESVELEEEDLENFQLDRMNLIDKSLTSPSGTGPLPSLPGLQKGPFVSEACCVGVKVGVADEVPELELRFETAPVDDCVACDLSECDQEVVVPIQPLLQIQLHNQPAIDDLSACSIFDTANTSSGTHKDPIPIPISFPTLEPDISSASALSAIVGNTTKHHSPISSCVINREEDFGQSSGYLQDASLVRHEPGTGVSSAIIHKGTDAADNYNERDNTNDAESLDICSAKQVLESQEVYAQDSEPPSFHYPDNLLEEELENVNEYKNISGSKNEVCKLLNKYKQDNESLLINNIIQGDELRMVNNNTQDNELKTVNNSTQGDELRTVNNSTQGDELRTVNNNIQDDELKTVNNSTQGDELKTVNNSTQGDELKTVNNSTQDDELRTVNNNTQDDELKTVNNSTQDDELRTVNNSTQDDELRVVNNNIQDDELRTVNNNTQDDELKTVNNNTQDDELKTVNNNTQDDELRMVNNNTQDDELKTVNNSTQDDERRTVNNLIHDDELRIVNNNTQDDELRTVKNSKLDDELRTVNNNTQDDELRMVNNNTQDDELRIVNNNTQDDELRTVNNNTQDDELRTVNNSIQDDELRMVNNSIQGDEFRTVSNSTQADELWIVNNGSQDDELRIVNGTQEDELGIVNNGIENELRIMNNGTQDDDICYSHSQAQYELGCVNNNTHELWVSNNDTQKEEFGSIAEDTQENELVYKKMCLNKFSESLFRHIDSEESEISLPEEVVGDQNWEMVEAYEALDESATFSDTSDEEGKDCVATDNDTENLEVMSDSNEAASEDSHSEVCCDADVFRCQKFEKNKFYLETEIDIFNVDEKTRILPSNNDAGKFVSTYQKELFNDSDSLDMISEEETVQYDYVQLKESSSDDSDDSSTDDCTFSGSENMASYDLLHEIDDVAKTIDDESDTTFIIANTCSIKSSVAYEKLEDQTILDNILISSADKKTVEEQTSDNEEYDEHTKELEWNSNVAVEPKLFYNKELWKGPQEGLSTEAQKSLCNNSQKVMNERVKFLDSMLNGSVHKENIDTKINPVAENVNVMTVSLPEENGLKFNDDQICGIPDEPKCVDRYTFLETSSDSEIEGITGKHPGKYSGDSADDTSPYGQNWRYSDIDLIIEAESFVFPSDHVDSVSSCNLKKFQEQHQSVQGAQALSRDTILNTSFEDSQSLPRISKSSYGKKNTRVLPQESAEIDVQSTNVTFSGPLTATVGSVATLTQSDTSCALTLQQSASHTRKACPTWDEIMKSVSFTSGQIQWTQPLPSYPVYGTSYLVSSVTSTTPGQPGGIPGLNGKRLLVKIVKATGVGCDSLVSEAYAVVEMDEPPQKFSTSVVKETSSPFWDEQFLFDLSGGTLELLFEVYDKKDGNFLGLGIVGIEELVATPSQRQIIPLQSRPYENDEVSGSLTVEFLFLDRADLPEHTLRSSATSQSLTPKGDLITTTTTTYVKAPESQDVVVNGGDGIAAAVLRDIEGKKVVVANNASKSTMIIHASRKEITKKVIQVERAPSGEYKELTVQPDEEGDHLAFPSGNLMALTTTATTTTPTITTTPTRSAGTATGLMPTTPTRTTSTSTTETTADGAELNETDERGRSRGVRRKRDSFFGTLKKRFSRSKVRSKSVDPSARDTSMDRDASVGRSVSVERSSNINRASEEQQVKPSFLQDTIAPTPAHYLYLLHAQRLLAVPANVGGDGGSTRSSLSDASAISGSSTRTYVNEASTLIIETSENGVFKHYLIPLALQQKSKWRKKGLKLHIFGEHTFVAKHMSSSTPCEVCQKTLGRRFGKQGYVCRDCGFKCHKPCHVKTEAVCPNSTVNTMDLEYVKDSREERRAWHRKAIAT